MYIKVLDSNINIRSGVSAKNGKEYTIREQQAYLIGDLERGEITLMLTDKQEPYPPNDYQFDLERSIKRGRFGQLEIRPVLIPAASVKAVA